MEAHDEITTVIIFFIITLNVAAILPTSQRNPRF